MRFIVVWWYSFLWKYLFIANKGFQSEIYVFLNCYVFRQKFPKVLILSCACQKFAQDLTSYYQLQKLNIISGTGWVYYFNFGAFCVCLAKQFIRILCKTFSRTYKFFNDTKYILTHFDTFWCIDTMIRFGVLLV